MKQFRKERVAHVIRNVIGEALVHQMNDPRLSPLTSITRVNMTSDLQVARVFVSVSGGETQERKTIRAMAHARGFLQRLVAAELSIRHCPELRFEIDEVGKTALTTLSLIERNRREREANEPAHDVDVAGPEDRCADSPESTAPGRASGGAGSSSEHDPADAPYKTRGAEE